jgi:hypothetical protein
MPIAMKCKNEIDWKGRDERAIPAARPRPCKPTELTGSLKSIDHDGAAAMM